jgi:metallo-beta-lactamase family protein
MKIEFVGGARTVTGSSFIVKGDGYSVMVDCGMFQGSQSLRNRNTMDLVYAPGDIGALLLTHAHIDHSGLIPRLVKRGFSGSIFATDATVDLCSIMLPDSAHVQEMDIEWINKKNKKMGKEQVDPLYTMDDAEACLKFFVPVKYGDTVQVLPNVRARFRDEGHILGSSFIEMWVEENGRTVKILFSGDIGSREQALIRDPEKPEEADVLLIESTYGDRAHKNRTDTYAEFKNIIVESHNNKGNIVIPSFAVERTQEIIYTLGRLFKSGVIPRIPVYIDSPLAISATEVFKKHRGLFDDEMQQLLMSGENPLEFPNLFYTKTSEESKGLNEEKGAIIISASGMCTAGRIKYHLQNNLYKPESSVIFVGYQAEGTLGRRLVDGAKMVKVYGDDVVVRAKIHTLGGFSGHADMNGLIDWLSSIKSDNLKVFIVHGEEKASINLSRLIEEKYHYKTNVPMWGETVDIDSMESSYAEYGAVQPEKPLDGEMDQLMMEMKTLIDRYKGAKSDNKLKDAEKIESGIRELRGIISALGDDL